MEKMACIVIYMVSGLLVFPVRREQVQTMLSQMHELYKRGYTPKVKPTKSCNACSLKELCLPKLMRNKSVSAYLKAAMEEPL